jgi:drug/metabolite transporter superfamily protein YnfA
MFLTDLHNLILSVALFAGICCAEILGHWLGRRAVARSAEITRTGAVEAAVLALLGLLLGFSFSAAGSRLDYRRQLIVQEANAIGTAWLRLDLLSTDRQPELRDLFRRYTDARIGIVRLLPDLNAALAQQDESIRLQNEIWPKAVDAANATKDTRATLLLLPALNDMIDITTTREIAARTHTPMLIIALIFAVAILSGLVAGYGMCDGRRINRLHLVILAAIVAITVYVILDLENPRAGLIRLDAADRAMEMVRASMK